MPLCRYSKLQPPMFVKTNAVRLGAPEDNIAKVFAMKKYPKLGILFVLPYHFQNDNNRYILSGRIPIRTRRYLISLPILNESRFDLI